MASRFPLYNAATTPPISPNVDGGWAFDLSTRSKTTLSLITESLSLLDKNITSGANQPRVYKQYSTIPLIPGQTIIGGQAFKAQCLVGSYSTLGTEHFRFALGARILADDGVTLRKTLVVVQQGASNMPHTDVSGVGVQNRSLVGATSAGNYTTVLGDRLVIEIGTVGVSPAGTFHNFMNLGYSASGWLPENDTSLDLTLSPWFQLNDTLTFTETLQPDTGSYSLSGQTTNAKTTRLITPTAGAYSFAGQDVVIHYAKLIRVDVGVYTLTGVDVDKIKLSMIKPNTGAYGVFGQDALLNHNIPILVDAGEYVLDGQNIIFINGRAVIVNPGAYSLNGQSVDLQYSQGLIASGVAAQGKSLYWLLIDE